MVEDTKQAVTQCTVEVAVIQFELEGLRAKISTPTKLLKGKSRCLSWGPIGSGIPQGQFWG